MKIGDIVKKSTLQFNIKGLSIRDLLPLFNRLKELEFTEEKIYSRLQVPDKEFILSTYLPFYLRIRMKENTLLDRLIKLFLFAMPLKNEEINDLFDRSLLDFCIKVGLIENNDGVYSSNTDLYPCMNGFFATDHQFSPRFKKHHVYPLGYDSYMLARGMVNTPSENTLDLCTGSGVQAITAAKFSGKVTGVDVNPRALNFARFNALLNQVKNVKFVLGDLYEPVKNEKFDMILANPPFVPAPRQNLYFRDGNESGEGILEKIIAGIPSHLNDEGYAQIVTLLVFMKGQDYNDKLFRWLNFSHYNILTLATRYIDVEPFILGHINPDRKFSEYCDMVESWALNYKENNITKLADGLINIKHSRKTKGRGCLKNTHRVAKPFSNKVEELLGVIENSHDDKFKKELMNREFGLNNGIDFFWNGRETDGKNKYGVLFKEEALMVENTELGEIHYDILSSISTEKIMGNEIYEKLKQKHEDLPEENFQNHIVDLLVDDIIEIF